MSQSPVTENLNSFIRFDPKVNFKAEVTSEGMIITSEEFDVAKSYTMTLKAGMKGKIGGTLKEDYTATITFGKLEPQINIVNKKGVYLSPKGAKNIEVRISSIKKVKVTNPKIYQNNYLASTTKGSFPNELSGSLTWKTS